MHDAAHDLHYFCKRTDGGEVELFYLKPNGEPTAILIDTIAMEQFKESFNDCSTHDCNLKPKSEGELAKEEADTKVFQSEQHLERKEFYAAASEFGEAIKKYGENLNAHLDKGKAHIELGETEMAKETFSKMSKIDDLYDKENKHLFNEYGIELRRGQLYDLAI